MPGADDIEAMIVPIDLAAALAADPLAERNFAALPDAVRKMVPYRISKATRAETRVARITEAVATAVENRAPVWVHAA
ncbi:MAG: YdeI/OmpD-associated family protein [Microbacteriaceae bacterium]|nr:YdeI/OmpD-associated family protein [Microbacteriaceae bacterium]